MGEGYEHSSHHPNTLLQYTLIAFQVICLAAFYFLKAHYAKEDDHTPLAYGPFQDVHVMIFIGFGYLMTFLKSYNWSSVGFTFLIGSICIQWSMILHGLLLSEHGFAIGFKQMFEAEFAAGAILISFGAVLGKISHIQLVMMGIFDVLFYTLNQFMIFHVLPGWLGWKPEEIEFLDMGGSMIIHAFGAYFGLAASQVLFHSKHEDHENEGSSYTTDLFAMIGTIFLWLYWPSFNSIPSTDPYEKQIVITNTYLSLIAACITTFAVTGFSDKLKRIDIVHIQNATLAGGVAMGSSCNIEMTPFTALCIGTVAGAVSTLGYQYLQDFLLKKLQVHDTCGVHNLHGMPGVLGAIFSMITCSIFDLVIKNKNYSVAYQACGLASTLTFAIVGGVITGYVMKFIGGLNSEEHKVELFEDREHWAKED